MPVKLISHSATNPINDMYTPLLKSVLYFFSAFFAIWFDLAVTDLPYSTELSSVYLDVLKLKSALIDLCSLSS